MNQANLKNHFLFAKGIGWCNHLELFSMKRLSFRDRDMKLNGWGWKDSYFFVNDRNVAEFTGNRYGIFRHLNPYVCLT